MPAVPSRRCLVLLALAVAAWVAPGIAVPAARNAQTTADEPQYLMTALSLARDHDLDVADERAEGRYRAFHRVDLPQQEAVRDGGVMVSPHDPLLPALLAVPMALGGWVAAKATLALLAGALAAAMVWVATRRFGVPSRAAIVTVLAFSAAAPLAVYGTQVYPEIVAALAVTIAIGAITAPRHERRAAVVATAAIVALPWLSVKYAPVVVALAGVAAWRWWRAGAYRRVAVFGAALVCAALAFAVAHVAWYGGITPYASGSHFASGEFGVVGDTPNYLGRSVRLIGLLVDRDFGLAAWQPAYLLAIAALVALVRQRPRHSLVVALPLVAGWLNASFVALTMQGWWFPGRQTVVVLPCIVLAVAWWAAQSEARVRVVAVAGLFGASVFAWFVVQGIAGNLTFVVTFETITHPLVRAWRLVLPDYRDGTALDWALHTVWIAAVAAFVRWQWAGRLLPEQVRRPARARATGALVDA